MRKRSVYLRGHIKLDDVCNIALKNMMEFMGQLVSSAQPTLKSAGLSNDYLVDNRVAANTSLVIYQ